MAAQGYPGAYAKGSQIRGLEELPEDSRHMVFHAGTAARDGGIIASGGRVLNVTARGSTWPRRGRPPMPWSTASTGPAASAAATSAGAPCDHPRETGTAAAALRVRGSVLPHIAPTVLGLMAVSALLVALDGTVGPLKHVNATPFAVFGVALSLFPRFSQLRGL